MKASISKHKKSKKQPRYKKTNFKILIDCWVSSPHKFTLCMLLNSFHRQLFIFN